ncbi:MAG: hypothetical protein LH660_05055 [Phormidesmis sp. CAN_BIN36]|nr:hypothetical protein [Phormidesmis sp. CAN_BIN36]
MRHSLSVEPSTHASSSLHPKLQRALGCLDMRLDEELARYRRQKAGRSTPSIEGLRLKLVAKGDLMSFSSADVTSTSPSGDDRAASIPPVLSASIPLRHDPVEVSELSSDLAVISADRDDGHETLTHSLQSEANYELTDPSTPADDYLESSEELLRSLAREEAQVQVERGFLESLMTPLGVGAMLMLLLSSAMFGYVVMNPSSLGGLSQIFARRDPSPTPIATQPPQEDISNKPPLDAKEFVDLGLGNLTTLKTRQTNGLPQNGKPSPAPLVLPSKSPALPKVSQPSAIAAPSVPSPANASAGSAPVLSAPAIRPNPAPVAPSYPRSSYIPAPTIRRFVPVAPLPTVPIPRPQPPIERAPAPAPKADYHVDTPYDNDRTYDKIQQSNAGAEFVNTPEGGFIRSGSYRSEAEAKAKVEELQNQGIPAEVRK